MRLLELLENPRTEGLDKQSNTGEFTLVIYLPISEKDPNRHINVLYNRVNIKNYTRLAFANDFLYKSGVLRRAIDDKAYLWCNTSEGFSRLCSL